MNIDNIKSIINDLEQVLTSTTSDLSESDIDKLSQAKTELESKLKNKTNAEISIEDKVNFIQIIVLIMEIIKNISDHWK